MVSMAILGFGELFYIISFIVMITFFGDNSGYGLPSSIILDIFYEKRWKTTPTDIRDIEFDLYWFINLLGLLYEKNNTRLS
jgi:hypothetical protein